MTQKKIFFTNSDLDIPVKFALLHESEVKEFRIIFNAKSSSDGLVILSEVEYAVFKLIDGIKTISSIMQSLQQRCSKEQVLETLQYLAEHYIIHTHHREPQPVMNTTETASIWVHLTNQCNLRCTYCYIDKTESHLDENPGKVYLHRALEILKDKGFKKVQIRYAGGEPMMRFKEMLTLTHEVREYADEIGLDSAFRIISNGTLMTRERAEILKEENIRVSISMDGIGPSHDINRPFVNGKGSVDSVLKGLDLLKGVGVQVGINVVVSASSAQHFPEMVRFCLERNIKYTVSFARENLFSQEAIQPENQQLINGMRDAFQEVRKNFPERSLLSGLDLISFASAHTLPACGVESSYIVLSEKGEASSCHMLMNQPQGSIMDPDISSKLFNKQQPDIGFSSEEKDGCNTCTWRYVCAGGCPAATKLAYGTSKRSSPFCLAYKALIPDLINLEAERIIHQGQAALQLSH